MISIYLQISIIKITLQNWNNIICTLVDVPCSAGVGCNKDLVPLFYLAFFRFLRSKLSTASSSANVLLDAILLSPSSNLWPDYLMSLRHLYWNFVTVSPIDLQCNLITPNLRILTLPFRENRCLLASAAFCCSSFASFSSYDSPQSTGPHLSWNPDDPSEA